MKNHKWITVLGVAFVLPMISCKSELKGDVEAMQADHQAMNEKLATMDAETKQQFATLCQKLDGQVTALSAQGQSTQVSVNWARAQMASVAQSVNDLAVATRLSAPTVVRAAIHEIFQGGGRVDGFAASFENHPDRQQLGILAKQATTVGF